MANVNISINTCYKEHHITVTAVNVNDAKNQLNHAKDAIDSRLVSEKQNKEKTNG